MTAPADIERAVQIAQGLSESRRKISFFDPLTMAVDMLKGEMIRVLLETHPDVYDARFQMHREIEVIAGQTVFAKRQEIGRCTYSHLFEGDVMNMSSARQHRIKPDGVRETLNWYADSLRHVQAEYSADGWVMCPYEVLQITSMRDAKSFDVVLIMSLTAGKIDAGSLREEVQYAGYNAFP